MFKIYQHLINNHKNRLFILKMEDLIVDSDESISRISKFLGAEPREGVYSFFKNNRNNFQKARYGNKLVKNVDLYKDLINNFEGYFRLKDNDVAKAAAELDEIIQELNYNYRP